MSTWLLIPGLLLLFVSNAFVPRLYSYMTPDRSTTDVKLLHNDNLNVSVDALPNIRKDVAKLTLNSSDLGSLGSQNDHFSSYDIESHDASTASLNSP